jgi:hypothetical protein
MYKRMRLGNPIKKYGKDLKNGFMILKKIKRRKK